MKAKETILDKEIDTEKNTELAGFLDDNEPKTKWDAK
jgi:hypothetical protein